MLDLLDAQPLIANSVVFLVVQGGDKLLALGAIAVGVDSLVGVLVNYIMSHHSHNFYSFLLEKCSSLFLSVLYHSLFCLSILFLKFTKTQI